MDCYTGDGLRLALERYGLFDRIREKGFDDLHLSTHTDDPDHQMVRIHSERPDPEHLLVELVTRFRTLVAPEQAVVEGAEESYRVVSIEWLLMQNPRASFSLDRKRLPGQKYPGLGIGRWMVELLRMMSERLDCCGLMNIPEHYHNAYIYSKQMLFFCPEDQGYFEGMKSSLGHLPLVETSVAIDEGRLRLVGRSSDQVATTASWQGKPQVLPSQQSLTDYFGGRFYRSGVEQTRDQQRFVLA